MRIDLGATVTIKSCILQDNLAAQVSDLTLVARSCSNQPFRALLPNSCELVRSLPPRRRKYGNSM